MTGSIAAAVTGPRLAEMTEAQFREVRQAFLDHCMLIFPGQFLAPADQHRFAARFGEVMVTPMLRKLEVVPGVINITNRGKANSAEESWHYDSIYLPEPPAITILAAQTLPPAGGDTMWSNQYLAYDRLSAGMKALLRGLHGKFMGTRQARYQKHDGDVPWTLHPLVRVHPVTGRPALLVGHPETLPEIEDMSPAESRPLLDYLYAHSTRPDGVYRHVWQPGDVAMWDNRCTMHYAVHDYGDETVRSMNRITVKGTRPVGFQREERPTHA